MGSLNFKNKTCVVLCVFPVVDCTEHHGSLYAGQDVKWWCSTTCFWHVVRPPTWSESGNLRGQGLECHGVFQGAAMQGKTNKKKNVLSFFFQLQIEMASGKVIIDKEALESDAKLRTCRLFFYFSF
jgi:hypothetical protein